MAEIVISPELEKEILDLPTDNLVRQLCLRHQYVQENKIVTAEGQPYPVCHHCPSKVQKHCRLLELSDFDLF